MQSTGVRQKREMGLSEEEAKRSRAEHGSNLLSTRPQKSFISQFLSNLGDPVIKILLVALAVDLIFVFWGGDIFETIGIAVSVFLATFISTVSERGGESAFRRLSEECSRSEFRVLRDGALKLLPIGEVVVGDLVRVGAGEQIPADGIIVSGRLTLDQSAMTGESREIEKYPTRTGDRTPSSPLSLFRGATVLSGEGELLVERVGDATFLGGISGEVQLDTRESPMKLRLRKLAKQISRLGYFAAALVALAYLFNSFFMDSGFDMRIVAMKFGDTKFLLESLLDAFLLGLTVVIVAVPEGLPMMIAVVLSSNIRRMIKDNVLVRKPVGIEAAGSMNILFTDKTGTLTHGRLGVGGIILGDCSSFSSAAALKRGAPEVFFEVQRSCRLNTSATLVEGSAVGGNSTERALLDFVSGFSFRDSARVVSTQGFDSSRKYSSATLFDGRRLLKGAPEVLLPYVRYALSREGRSVSFASLSYEFYRTLSTLTSSGNRVLLIAFEEREAREGFSSLTLVCAVVLNDGLREEARSAVGELKGAGIQVVMITGDNRDTAESIAKRCGIIDRRHNRVISSEELSRLSDAEVGKLLPTLAVVARALPQDKSRLVRIAQEKGFVAGMTGDGINDAPALKRADIGFAMGGGTQVAKDAGDIIITDGNLSSIAKAVLYGRTIFKSIRKFITLQLTMNFCAVGVSMISPFLGIDAPVTVVQMLWINIIMDTLGGLAFAGEKPLPSYMREPPKRRDEPILNRYMINQIVILGGFTVSLCLAFLKLPFFTSHFRASSDNIYLLTAFFVLFIFSSVFNCFNARTDRLRLFAGISGNKAFCLIMLAVCFVQILFVYLGGSILRTTPLYPEELCFAFLAAFSVFPAELLRKILWRIRGKKEGF